MAPVISSPPLTLERVSTPPTLDLMPKDFADSSPSHLPRPATPGPHFPSSPMSSPPLHSSAFELDFLPRSLPDCSPVSILGSAPPMDIGLLSSSPAPLSFHSNSLQSSVISSVRSPSPPSPVPYDPDGSFLDPVSKAGRSANSVLIDAILSKSPSTVILDSAAECGGSEGFSQHLNYPEEPSPLPMDRLLKGLKILEPRSLGQIRLLFQFVLWPCPSNAPLVPCQWRSP